MNSFNLSCIVVAIILVGCGDSVPNTPSQGYPGAQQQYQQPAGQPVVIVQQPAQQANSNTGDMLMGAAVGAMLMNSVNNRPNQMASTQGYQQQAPQTIVNRTVINKTIIQQAPPVAPQPAPVASVVVPKPVQPVASVASVASVVAPKPVQPVASVVAPKPVQPVASVVAPKPVQPVVQPVAARPLQNYSATRSSGRR